MKDKYIKYIFLSIAIISFSCICVLFKDSNKFNTIPIVKYDSNLMINNK